MNNRLIELLPIVQGQGWTAVGPRALLRNDKGQCPLCALAGAINPKADRYRQEAYAALRLAGVDTRTGELRWSEVADVMNAADMRHHISRPALLEALGLERE